MTLADLANYICGMVNQTEPADLAACKLFLQQRFKMIWADQLWKDSLFEYTQTLVTPGYTVASTWMPTKKVLLLPTLIDAVIAVRTDTRKLNVESSERLYRMDFDNFNNAGSVTMFRILSPAVWEFDTAQIVYAAIQNAADVNAVVTVDTLAADGVTLARQTPALQQPTPLAGQSLGSIQRIDAVSKLAGNGPVTLSVGLTSSVSFTDTDPGALDFFFGTGAVGHWVSVAPAVQPGQTTPSIIGSPQAQVGAAASHPGSQPTITAAVPASFVGTISASLAGGLAFDAVTGMIVVLQAADLVAKRRQRIQMLGTVPEGSIVRVLGKVAPPTFTADNDVPGLTGCENVLIAFGQADMLKRSRQYGKSAAVQKEGMLLLEQLKRVQVVQQANHKRLMPEDGYGWEYATNFTSPLQF